MRRPGNAGIDEDQPYDGPVDGLRNAGEQRPGAAVTDEYKRKDLPRISLNEPRHGARVLLPIRLRRPIGLDQVRDANSPSFAAQSPRDGSPGGRTNQRAVDQENERKQTEPSRRSLLPTFRYYRTIVLMPAGT